MGLKSASGYRLPHHESPWGSLSGAQHSFQHFVNPGISRLGNVETDEITRSHGLAKRISGRQHYTFIQASPGQRGCIRALRELAPDIHA